MKRKNVFFSAPATQDERERERYQSIVDGLRNLGFNITYNWLNDKEDYDTQSTTKKSIRAIEIADLVVAENTTPSTGVGSQIALAQSKRIPVIILTRSKSSENHFFNLAGADSKITSCHYTSENLKSVLTSATAMLAKERLVKFNFISTPEINQKIEIGSKKLNLSKSEYLRKLLSEYFKQQD